MLRHLYIKDFTLIDQLDIDFYPGFSVITGETGAGKSIILGALGLLLGNRADVKQIKNGEKKCVIEAHFDLADSHLERLFSDNDIDYDAQDCILRREINANGKSRAFVNDSPVSIAVLKELGEHLIDIHSQHQNLLLNKEGFQLNILDILAQDEAQLSTYRKAYNDYRKTTQELDEFKSLAEKSRQDEDYIRFQLEQLEEASLKSGEQQELEKEQDTLSHAEDIKSVLYKAGALINGDEGGALSLTKECMQSLQSIAGVFAPAAEWAERINSYYIELKDIAHDITRAEDEVEFNPTRLDFVNERLNTIYSLTQKHKVETVEELIALEEGYRKQLDAITSFDGRIAELSRKKDKAYAEVLAKADVLSQLRKRSAQHIEQQMKSLLVPLGMPNVRFEVELTRRSEPDAKGMDSVTFLFSANKNGTLQNVASIASGGEIARVMLSLKAMIAGAVKLPTIIFDEIDTGVSGSIAEKMAFIMQDMGKQNRQVISITHLPQIAARGTTHYKVYKEDTDTGTNSHIRQLSDTERIDEIANMLSGAVMTDAARDNARALLNMNKE